MPESRGLTKTSLAVGDGESFHSLTRALGVESFGITVMSLRPGQRQRVHLHQRQEEVYLVLEGELTLVVEGDDVVLGAGEIARVARHVRRQLTNRGPEPTRLLALGSYGEKHEPRDAVAWNSWEEGGDGGPPRDVPMPEDLPLN